MGDLEGKEEGPIQSQHLEIEPSKPFAVRQNNSFAKLTKKESYEIVWI